MRFLLFAVLLLGSCAEQLPPPHMAGMVELPGFWMGMLHGLTSWISLIGEIFDAHRIYAYPNSGGLYDAGFMIGCSFWFGIRYQGR